jgi:hypothetical protein
MIEAPPANGPQRAEFWREFVLERCGYPAADRLRAQFAGAEYADFCACGCNSFAVKGRGEAPPLVPPGGSYGAIFMADFRLADERTLEIILFADERGDLVFVEVNCCSNSYPVPEIVDADGPFDTRTSPLLLV